MTRKLRKNKVIGRKKLLCLAFKRGKVAYWKVLCLECGEEELISEYQCWRGTECNRCRLASVNSKWIWIP